MQMNVKPKVFMILALAILALCIPVSIPDLGAGGVSRVCASQIVFESKESHIKANCERGFVDKTGSIAFTAQQSSIMDWRFHEGLLLVLNLDGTYEYWNRKGELAFPQRFKEASYFADGLAPVRVEDKWGYIDRTGAMVIHPVFDTARAFSDGLAPVRMGNKWGYIDKTGRFAIEPRFVYCIDFSEGLAAASVPSGVGFIDKSGKFVIEPCFARCGSFSDGVASVISIEGEPKRQHRWFVNKAAEKVFDYDETLQKLSKEYRPETGGFKVFNYREVTIGQISQPLWNERFNDYYHVGRSYLEFSEGLLPVQLGHGESVYLRPDGSVAFRLAAEYVEHFCDGVAVVVIGDIHKWHYRLIDKSGRFIMPEQFDVLHDFSDGVAIAIGGPGYEGCARIIDKEGKVMGRVKTTSLSDFAEGLSRFGTAIPYIDRLDYRPVVLPENYLLPLDKLVPVSF
ncbi:MAG: WG repeat-containing protein [Cyanobacteria bacterium SZAS TMP-1]|nr:WG repeat-containing protein [Cyanobacteria bacterium SZAS TMP-1]